MTRCDLLACVTYIPGQRWLLRLFVPRDLGPLSLRRSASQPIAAADLSSLKYGLFLCDVTQALGISQAHGNELDLSGCILAPGWPSA